MLLGLILVAVAAVSWGTTGATMTLLSRDAAASPLLVGWSRLAVAAPVLRHRLLLRPEAELERYRPDDAVRAALDAVAVPR